MTDYPIIVSHGSDQLPKLILPFKKNDAIIDLYYPRNPRRKFLWVYFKERYPASSSVTFRLPYLVIRAGYVEPTELDAHMLVRGPARGGSQVACRSIKMSRVGVLSKLHNAVGNLATTFVFVSRLSLFRLSAAATFWPMSLVGIYPGRASGQRHSFPV